MGGENAYSVEKERNCCKKVNEKKTFVKPALEVEKSMGLFPQKKNVEFVEIDENC